MRKLFILITALLLALSFPLSGYADSYLDELEDLDLEYYSQFAGKGISINVYNWGEYISEGSDGESFDINVAFEELTGIRVNYTNFSTNEELYARLKGGTTSYDIVIPSDYMIGRLIGENMIQPLDFGLFPNYDYISDTFKNQVYDPNNLYSAPYMWGTVGIIYNKEQVDEEEMFEQGWDVLWNEKYLGDILMFSNPRDAFGIALLKLGYDLNTTNPDEIKEAADELKKQKLLVQAYVMDEIFDKMTGEEASLAPYYAGDAVTMMDENENIGFYIPESGTNLFCDAACIPSNAKQPAAAMLYINFLNEPQVAAFNCEYIGYSTPNEAALELLDEEVAENPISYPPEEVLANSQVYLTLPAEINTLLDELWTEMLTADDTYSAWLMPAFLLVAVGGSVVIQMSRRARKRREAMLIRDIRRSN